MLVPGFLAGDTSLARMAVWLRAGGWKTARPGVRFNVNCTETAVEALERRLEEAVEAASARALLVGQSRGGTMGRILAVRRPELIETLVTLGSPVLDQMAVSRNTRAMVNLIAGLGTLGVPGLFSRDCRAGACCELSRAQLSQPVSEDVRYVAFYSREDGVVSWEACLDPRAELVEVSVTHSGMGVSRMVWAQMAERLSR